jgi:undecaprenyl phosphate-alpha-L-ara4N flippase subunit ArnF
MNAESRWVVVALLTCSVVLSAVGQLCMKAGMQELGGWSAPTKATPGASTLTSLHPVIAWTGGGLLAYGVSMLIWLGVLVRYPLSLAYPMLGMSYVLVYWGATHWSLLMESTSSVRTVGTLLIVAGVALANVRCAATKGAP